MRTHLRSSVLENIIKQFFRINAVTYILSGMADDVPFAVEIPDLTTWKQSWRIVRITAIPQLTKRQSVVNFDVFFENKVTHEPFVLSFHDEIRWSHGIYCGNPEAKLYKIFKWSQVPFFRNIL